MRVATTGVPPRSRRKTAEGTKAIAILVLWKKEEGENREFLTEELRRLLVVPRWKEEEEELGLGLGFCSPL